jgi:23S rRNA (guanosine2251-2'-O)-methyltransferase
VARGKRQHSRGGARIDRDSDALMIGGPNAVEAALSGQSQGGQTGVFRVFLESGAPTRAQALATAAREAGIPVSSAGKGECDVMTGVRCQGIAAEIRFGYADLDDILAASPRLILFLDEIADPHNLGAIIRSAEAAGASAVVIPARRAAQVNATVMRVSAGAAVFLPVCRVTNLVRALSMARSSGFRALGLDQEGSRSLADALDVREPIALVIGSEGEGIRRLVRETCDELVGIPMRGRVESLNASVAAGVAVFTALAAMDRFDTTRQD